MSFLFSDKQFSIFYVTYMSINVHINTNSLFVSNEILTDRVHLILWVIFHAFVVVCSGTTLEGDLGEAVSLSCPISP